MLILLVKNMHAHDCSAPQTKAATTVPVPELPATWKDPITRDVHHVNATSFVRYSKKTDHIRGATEEPPGICQGNDTPGVNISKVSSCTNRTSTESPVHQLGNATSNMKMTTDNTNGAVAERPVYSQKNSASHNHMSKAYNRIDGTAIESPVSRQENAVSLLYTNKAAKSKNEARTELPVSHQENAASHTRMSKASSGTSNAGVESMVPPGKRHFSHSCE